MVLGRSTSGAIKIKTDGGLRAVSCGCCGGCAGLSVIAEFSKFGYPAFDGSARRFLKKTFVDDGCPDAEPPGGIGTVICEYDECGVEQFLSTTGGPGGELDYCEVSVCPSGEESFRSATQLDIACGEDGCGDDHIYLSDEFTTLKLEEIVDRLLDGAAPETESEDCCAVPSFSEGDCNVIEVSFNNNCTGGILSFFYSDNNLLNEETSYIQKRKVILKNQNDKKYCKRVFNINGSKISESQITISGDVFVLDPPDELGWIELVSGDCE
jgi:hypothetical protein